MLPAYLDVIWSMLGTLVTVNPEKRLNVGTFQCLDTEEPPPMPDRHLPFHVET